MKNFLLLMGCLFVVSTVSAQAQDVPANNANLPPIPESIQDLVDKGAQIRYLGKRNGLDGWITIFQGQEQYYYVTPDQKGFVMGVLFDADGNMATVDQVRDLQKQGGDILDMLAVEPDQPKTEIASIQEAAQYKSPAERMFVDVENSNWIKLGKNGAPVIYSFVDPQCPHCHEFIKDLKADYLDKGLVQVKIIPVGFRAETLAQAAFLLASPDAETKWFKHLDGTEPLPAKTDVSTQGVQKNLALMQAWKFTATPLSVYRDRAGEIKIIRGRAKDLAAVLADLPSP
ncbi:MAG: thioredoxin fold domain-containing protein [Alphaproteobacteria bacterium]|nr:thioredoxin fold domain-containing protein [Alphaproteobacteria bacterium]